ncbi:flagellar hook-length control protein FliK [Brachyspira sp. G79]|uniref:flagellar hook-length control protein FliK n=1 Tax=Brachyspira sp. G79 TaxID=1358104 RepID=UPI000BBC50AA|nr:flagellar hook-length control protein FliK [Brachyspira sp. G79]PCG20468.1 flagellar hook-length control protein [Brachyspira sp. G79]
MINGLGNLLSFVDTNVSSNNNTYSLNNHSYDDSFANMLNKTQTEDIYSAPSSVSNKIVERNNTEDYSSKNYNDYEEYNNDYNNYDSDNVANSSAAEEKISSKETNSENNTNKSSENTSNEENKVADNTEDKTVKENKDEIKADNNSQEKTDKTNSENISLKEKLALTKEKAKLIIQNASNNDDKKVLVNTRENAEATVSKLDKADKKENIKNAQDIESIKKQIEALNLEDLNEEDKKELEDLIESLENIKAMIDSNNNEEGKKEVLTDDIKDSIEVKDTDINKEIKIVSNKDNDKKIETINTQEPAIDFESSISDINIANNIDNVESKYADKYDKDNAEVKNNNSTVSNTISDDKGAELTIINMKDSAEGSNLKGYNHYNNNVSKTHNSTNITDSMIKFQDLMGKLVEKAQVAVNNGKSEVLMSLNPEYLGKIRLKISMDGDNLIGKIFVDNADVKDIFTKNLDTVITSLNEIGINIEGFDVMLRQDMPNNDGGFGEELDNIGNRFASENIDNVEEVRADIKSYIVPEKKLNLLI